MKVKNLFDWRGGYATDIPSELMAENEGLIAENCQWRGKIIKRNGIKKYSATDFSGASHVLRGGIRAYINGAWYTIIAYDDDTSVGMYRATTTTYTAINTSAFTKGYNVEFTELNGYVIAVNGHDKPEVIYYDGAWICKTLEALDVRTRETANWWAGQWDNSGAGATQFIDDTTDAQDAGVDDFEVGNATANDGCYISCDFPFNKILFVGCEQAAGAPVAEYKYWDGSDWTTVGTLVTDPGWTDVAGGKTVEFNIPLDSDGSLLWEPYGEVTTSGIANKYILRIRFTTAPTGAFSADYLEVSHTQYLTQIMENERPHTVCTHGSRVHMAANNVVNISPYNQVTGWRAGEVEYFQEGGNKVQAMVSYQDALLVIKSGTLYSFTGNSYETWVKSQPLTSVGTIAPRSVKVAGNIVSFVGWNGIYIWNGADAIKVSGHIQTDIDSYTLTDSCAVFYDNEYWISFPTNEICLTFDPDTFRQAAAGTDIGEGRVSFFKFKSYLVEQFIYCNGNNDTGYLLGLASPTDNTYLVRCDTGTRDDLDGKANTDIDMIHQTKYFSNDDFQTKKFYTRVKPKLKQVSSAPGAPHTFTMYADEGIISKTKILRVTTGSGYYSKDVSIHYTLDGKLISFYLRHNKSTSAALIGYAFEVANRRF